jgi:hypothetical protein
MFGIDGFTGARRYVRHKVQKSTGKINKEGAGMVTGVDRGSAICGDKTRGRALDLIYLPKYSLLDEDVRHQ